MAKKLTTYEKLRRAFEQLGVEFNPVQEESFLTFKYESHVCALGIMEDESIFLFSKLVVVPNRELPKDVFDTALEIVQRHYPGITGVWKSEFSFINSPTYTLEGRRNLPKTLLQRTLNKFFEAYLNMEYCIFQMMEDVEDENEEDKDNANGMDEK